MVAVVTFDPGSIAFTARPPARHPARCDRPRAAPKNPSAAVVARSFYHRGGSAATWARPEPCAAPVPITKPSAARRAHTGQGLDRLPSCPHPVCRYVDPPHRWRKVAAGRQTIPKFIEVVFKISLKIRNHLAVYASRPLVGSDPLIGFPHLPFRNVIRLGSIHEGPPVASCPLARAEQRNPFAPAPLQDLHHYYGLLRPCAPHRYSHPHRVHLFGFLP